MFCNRGIYHEGWKAVTFHPIQSDKPGLDHVEERTVRHVIARVDLRPDRVAGPEVDDLLGELALRDRAIGAKLAVSDVSMDARQRSITAIIGPSGCGKSTTGRLLLRLG